MGKTRAKMYGWQILTDENGEKYLVGLLFGHPKCRDGTRINTSPLVSIDMENKIAETKNTIIKLVS